MNEGNEPDRAPHLRLSAEQRDRFLEVLGQTGNRRFAAAAIGVEPRLMDQRRRFDNMLDRQWEEALAQADRRLAGANGPFDCIGARELNVIRRGRGGRLRLVAAGARRWSKAVEDRFLAALAMCGNIAAAARAVGFSESCVWQRRRKWPDFARRMEEVLEDAEVRLEFRMATMGNDCAGVEGTGDTPLRHSRESGNPGGMGDARESEQEKLDPMMGPPSRCPGDGAAPSFRGDDGMGRADGGKAEAIPFDPDLALRFLKWREEKRRGGGHRGRARKGPPERTFKEAVDSVLRKVEAIERHENTRKLAEGWSKDEEGRMIPPGWVRAP